MVTSEKRLMMLFKLNMYEKMLRFRPVTSTNLKIGKLSFTLENSKFQGLFVNEFDTKSS